MELTTPTRRLVALFLVGAAIVLAAPGGAGAAARGCVFSGPQAPTPSTAAPPADALSAFGVLGRPAGAADQIPVVNNLGVGLSGQLASYDAAYVRFLATLPDGRQLFVIPGTRALPQLPPPSCVPAKERPALEHAIQQQAKLAAPGPVYCLALIGGTSIFPDESSPCLPFELARNGYALDSIGQKAIGQPARTLAGLVPDGVAKVQLTFASAAQLIAPAVNNGFVASGVFRHLDTVERHAAAAARAITAGRSRAAQRLLSKRLQLLQRRVAAAAIPTHVRWLGPAGEVIATFTPPAGTAGEQELGTLTTFTESTGSGQSSFGGGIAVAPA